MSKSKINMERIKSMAGQILRRFGLHPIYNANSPSMDRNDQIGGMARRVEKTPNPIPQEPECHQEQSPRSAPHSDLVSLQLYTFPIQCRDLFLIYFSFFIEIDSQNYFKNKFIFFFTLETICCILFVV